MAEKKEKDNFWLYIGGIIVATILLVVVLKGRETEHLTGGYEELQKEVSEQMKAEGQNE
jgi:hypothetical protein